jgi:hypothetical protein
MARRYRNQGTEDTYKYGQLTPTTKVNPPNQPAIKLTYIQDAETSG